MNRMYVTAKMKRALMEKNHRDLNRIGMVRPLKFNTNI